jgi:hypothetical protein
MRTRSWEQTVPEPTLGEPSKKTTDALRDAADWRDHISLGWVGVCAALAGGALRFSGLGEIGDALSYGLWLIAAVLLFVSWSRRRAARRAPRP